MNPTPTAPRDGTIIGVCFGPEDYEFVFFDVKLDRFRILNDHHATAEMDADEYDEWWSSSLGWFPAPDAPKE